MIVLLLPLLPFYLLLRELQLRTASKTYIKARLMRKDYVDRVGWLVSFEVYGRTLRFEAGRAIEPPAEGTTGLLAHRAWQFISFEPWQVDASTRWDSQERWTEMRPPFILVESDDPGARPADTQIYATASALIADVEAIDVENGEYVVYDSHGRLLILKVQGRAIALESAEDEPGHADTLHRVLEHHLLSFGEWAGVDREWVQTASLPDLLQEVNAIGERWADRPRFWKRLRARWATRLRT